jgi:hypothetical protein
MTHGLSAETERMGGNQFMAKQTAEEWYIENNKGTIRLSDIKYLLWDWQNERVTFIKLLQDLEWSNETIDGVKVCPMCGWSRNDGHHSSCKLYEVIK